MEDQQAKDCSSLDSLETTGVSSASTAFDRFATSYLRDAVQNQNPQLSQAGVDKVLVEMWWNESGAAHVPKNYPTVTTRTA